MGGHGRLFVFLFGRGDHLCIFYLGGDDPFLCFSLEDVVCFLFGRGLPNCLFFYLEGDGHLL